MMMQAMDLFFKMMKNDKAAEAYNNYSLGLLALIEHQPKRLWDLSSGLMPIMKIRIKMYSLKSLGKTING